MGTITTSRRQLAWVFDLNKCIGCQTCSVACRTLWNEGEEGRDHMWWMSVNTLPGRGTPRAWETMGGGYGEGGAVRLGHLPSPAEFGGGWDYNYAEVLSGGGGTATHLHKTKGAADWGMNWDEDEGAGQYPNSYYFYMPRMCNHCTRPVCVEACLNDALFKDREEGLVLRDEDRCQGAQDCARACPYKKIYFNAATGVSQHCMGCFPRIEQGVAPACVRQCPGRAAFVGFLDDPDGIVAKLVHTWKVALPLHPEFGTEPNVYYVPPLAPPPLDGERRIDAQDERIPRAYLEELFGPPVGEALERLRTEMQRKRQGLSSELMDTLILYHWKDCLGHLDRDPADIVW